MLQALLFSTAAGVIGTGLGGVIGLVFGNSSWAVVSYLLSFASGVMVSIVCFDLVPEALEMSGVWWVTLFVVLGVAVVMALNHLIDAISNLRQTHIRPEELRHQKALIDSEGRRSMLRSGFVMLAAIALHNLPEGMAIGSGIAHSAQMGISLAILIMLHNIPEGMSIGIPLVEGGMSKAKAVCLTALSGAPTLVGGWVGALLGGGGERLMAASLSLAGGAMLYVTYCEILPQVILLNRGRRPAVFTIIGVLFGLVMVEALS